jgi:hypothetical protein
MYTFIFIHIKQCRGQEGILRTPDSIILGVDISPSTEKENFLLERKELISLIKLEEKSIFD